MTPHKAARSTPQAKTKHLYVHCSALSYTFLTFLSSSCPALAPSCSRKVLSKANCMWIVILYNYSRKSMTAILKLKFSFMHAYIAYYKVLTTIVMILCNHLCIPMMSFLIYLTFLYLEGPLRKLDLLFQAPCATGLICVVSYITMCCFVQSVSVSFSCMHL